MSWAKWGALGVACVVGYLTYSVEDSRAEYRYITGDPVAAQLKIINDIQSNHLDTSNLDDKVVRAIQQNSPFSPNADKLVKLGEVKQICLLFGVKTNNNRTIALRTVHVNGCGDWLIAIGVSPETINGITFMALMRNPDSCGAPAFLPVPPASDDSSFYIPPKIDCKNVDGLH
jgi:hypothetical protein